MQASLSAWVGIGQLLNHDSIFKLHFDTDIDSEDPLFGIEIGTKPSRVGLYRH
jgi:hypothetical protein